MPSLCGAGSLRMRDDGRSVAVFEIVGFALAHGRGTILHRSGGHDFRHTPGDTEDQCAVRENERRSLSILADTPDWGRGSPWDRKSSAITNDSASSSSARSRA